MEKTARYKVYRGGPYGPFGILDTETGNLTYLPPGVMWCGEGEAELVVRLRGTRGDRWFAGEGAMEALNRAPCEPVLRAVVDCFMWDLPGTLGASEADAQGGWVVQCGHNTPNLKARVTRPLADPLRATFERLHEKLLGRETEPGFVQGRLSLYELDASDVDGFDMLRAHIPFYAVYPLRKRYATVLNHVVFPVRGAIRRVVGDPPCWVVAIFPYREGERLWVMSRDHPSETVSFTTIPGKLVVGLHPFPADENVD